MKTTIKTGATTTPATPAPAVTADASSASAIAEALNSKIKFRKSNNYLVFNLAETQGHKYFLGRPKKSLNPAQNRSPARAVYQALKCLERLDKITLIKFESIELSNTQDLEEVLKAL